MRTFVERSESVFGVHTSDGIYDSSVGSQLSLSDQSRPQHIKRLAHHGGAHSSYASAEEIRGGPQKLAFFDLRKQHACAMY